MTSPSPKSFLSYQEILEHTRLGRLCGKKQLFQDRYQILQVLGRGGFGVTFLGRNVVIPGAPLCVIKQLCLPEGSPADALERAKTRFRKEAKILSLLGHHSQIPLLLDYFVMDEEFYLVQEFIKGYTLSKVVKRYGVQPEEFVTRTLKSLLPVLSYIHARGVIHRDIKPQNIILAADDGRLVLIDFGSVKEEFHLNDDATSCSLTQHFIGTLGFSPPEQFSLKTVYASDIYSLGMTCLFLITGYKPLDLQDETNKKIIKWRDKADISPQFANILEKMVDYDLDKRYNSASEVLEDLENISIMTNPLVKRLSEDDFNQWMSIQSKQNYQGEKKTKITQFKQKNESIIRRTMDNLEYSSDLLTSYSIYNKIAQGKNKGYHSDINEDKQEDLPSQNSLNPNSIKKKEDQTQEIGEEIREIQKNEMSFFPKIINNVQKIIHKFIPN